MQKKNFVNILIKKIVFLIFFHYTKIIFLLNFFHNILCYNPYMLAFKDLEVARNRRISKIASISQGKICPIFNPIEIARFMA